MVMAFAGACSGVATATPHRQLRALGRAGAGSGMTLAQAPAGLRAAVRRTIGAVQQADLSAADGTANDQFGSSVAVSGSTVVVGAADKNSTTGAAYVFVRSGSTWAQQAKLTASDGAIDDYFGWSVAISGSTVIVGAPYNTSQIGAAYVFTRSGSTWAQQAELNAFDGAVGDEFGYSVVISGPTVAVGAPSGVGAVYVFENA
jgi:hypothetical protein